MITAIVSLISIGFTVLAFSRLKLAYYFFVFMLPFMPRYVGIAVGTGSFSLKRIVVLLLLTGIFLSVITQPEKWKRTVGILLKWKMFIALLVLLYTVKLLSTLFNGGLSNILYWGDDFLVFFVIFLLTIRFIKDAASFRLLLFVLLSSLLITNCLGIIEYMLQHPLLQGINTEVLSSRDVLSTGIFRDDTYRAMALFDNPLLLSQFVVSVLPLVLSLALFRYSKAALAFVAGLSLVAIWSTGSRAGLLIITLSAMMYFLLNIYMNLVRSQKKVVTAIVVSSAVAGGWLLMKAIKDPLSFISGMDVSSGVVSIYARLMQYATVYDLVSVKPVLGYGMMANFAGLEALDGLDNYFLRLALEGGVSGIVIFFLLMLYSLKMAYGHISNRSFPVGERKVVLFLMLSIVAYLISGLFVSMPNNLTYLHLFVTLILLLNPNSRWQCGVLVPGVRRIV